MWDLSGAQVNGVPCASSEVLQAAAWPLLWRVPCYSQYLRLVCAQRLLCLQPFGETGAMIAQVLTDMVIAGGRVPAHARGRKHLW